ncbi:MAG: hypothetical protein NTY38_29570, partial [Acidobacteria bacterium]|nr:hypothetical protein [Acidobacteriota bacterium]
GLAGLAVFLAATGALRPALLRGSRRRAGRGVGRVVVDLAVVAGVVVDLGGVVVAVVAAAAVEKEGAAARGSADPTGRRAVAFRRSATGGSVDGMRFAARCSSRWAIRLWMPGSTR